MNDALSDIEQKKLRADLNAELGYYPATLDPDDIERHRRMNAASAADLDKVRRKWAWHREQRRRAAVEAEGRAHVADLYGGDGLSLGGGESAAGASGQECSGL
ncbi:hypothetical protein HZU40_23640 [Mycolicibacterium fluoranthenivorans]|uniref:Uncharacterized protein n=1 Tax=Mycolicibacterium fluoranthenivorans TaxID=258505 RepID=A0A7G8PA23_9MYCO|nr:hypothetical protein [Mycolicibacterium fluoranthenivorans]QNJ91189.1 hypothetical protein HZU40_23640 [Mycolicibacterium fluoranthenivorans]